MTDIIIVGAGPAGLTAAVYARRANRSVLVIEKETFGGQITFSPKVENIPGFTEISGNEFSEKLLDQALAQGAEVDSSEVLSVTKSDDGIFTVKTDCGEHTCRAVIIATGSKHRTLGLPNEENFIGNGISFCAVCDGAFYEGMDVAVVGGGNSALQEAILLSGHCKSVTVIQNLDFLTGEAKLQEQLAKRENIRLILGTVVDHYLGEEELKGVAVRSEKDGTVRDLAFDGVFLAVGLVPQNEAFKNILNLDSGGYSTADEKCASNVPGVFVAGDCRAKAVRQVTTAVSDGAVAALAASAYLG